MEIVTKYVKYKNKNHKNYLIDQQFRRNNTAGWVVGGGFPFGVFFYNEHSNSRLCKTKTSKLEGWHIIKIFFEMKK